MSSSEIEDIKSRINIVDFIGQYLRLQKAGANWKATCPFHNEKTPSFMVHEEKQIWHCFGCGKGGDVFSFLMEMEKLDFKEALKILAEKTGVELKRSGLKKETVTDKNKIFSMLELASKFYEVQLWKGKGGQKILDYLRARGINDDSIKEFHLGYAPPGWRNLLTFLLKRGYEIKDIAKTGLLVEKSKEIPSSEIQVSSFDFYDRFRDRITFPISDVLGRIIGFSARVAPGGDETQAKYVNTPETAVYHKSKILYGIDKAKKEIKDRDEAILVEGNTDVIACHQASIRNVVAVSGTALTSDQLDILKRYSRNLKLFFDMVEEGQAAALKSTKGAFQKGMEVSLVEISEGKDAAELAAQNPQLFYEAIKSARPAMEKFIDIIFSKHNKNDATGRKKIAEEVLEIVRHFENEIEKSFWIKKLSEMLDTDVKIIAGMLKRISGSKRIENKAQLQEKESFSNRLETIKKNLIGLMLSHPEVWKFIFEKRKDIGFLNQDSAFNLLIKKGKEVEFNLEKFLAGDVNDKLAAEFRQLAFEGKYIFSAKGQAEEISSEMALELGKKYFDEISKEIKKTQIANLLKDIKKAEKAGNTEEIRILVAEFNKLSKEIK